MDQHNDIFNEYNSRYRSSSLPFAGRFVDPKNLTLGFTGSEYPTLKPNELDKNQGRLFADGARRRGGFLGRSCCTLSAYNQSRAGNTLKTSNQSQQIGGKMHGGPLSRVSNIQGYHRIFLRKLPSLRSSSWLGASCRQLSAYSRLTDRVWEIKKARVEDCETHEDTPGRRK